MATFGIQVTGVDRVLKRMADLPGKLDRAQQVAVLRGTIAMERAWRKKATGEVLKVRTGAYRAAINKTAPAKTARGWEGVVGSKRGASEKYAAIHETGGTIRAKKKLLAIPLSRTKAGVARDSTPLDYPDGFWFKSRRGNILFGVADGRGGVTPLFLGLPSVKIPARRPMGRSFDEIRPTVLAEFDALVKRATSA